MVETETGVMTLEILLVCGLVLSAVILFWLLTTPSFRVYGRFNAEDRHTNTRTVIR